MPKLTGDPSSWQAGYIRGKKFNYEYPEDLDLHPESEYHTKLRSWIWQRARASRNETQKRFSSWREIDKTMTVYIPLKDKEERLKKKDPNKPVSVVFPYSYSMMEALLTYMTMAFFQDPIFQYEGFEDGDTKGAMLMEMVIRSHCINHKVALNIHTAVRDGLGYGVGIAIPEWRRTYGRRPVKSSITTQSKLGTETQNVPTMIEDLLYEGNALSNIDPYMWLPDPSVSSSEIQKGEFIGWVDRDNYMNLLSEESQPDSGMFNVKYLKAKKNKRSILALDQSERETKQGGVSELTREGTVTSPVDIIKMYVNLIPKDWGLSNKETPEKWYFELAGDDVIIVAEKADHNHGMYPMAVASPEFDGYSITPIGRMEVLYGLQHTLDFLFNSHIANVRKSINDMFVVDPYLVNINDLKDPQPGKLIRLRRPAWGRGVDKVVQQLQVTDITRGNIADSVYITQWMDRISGADQSMQGAQRQGGPERLTGVEFQGTRSSAVSRLQRIAMIFGMQFMQDVGNMFAVHTQQYMTEDTYVKIIGRYEEQLQEIFGSDKIGRQKVTPDDVRVGYDLIVRDGSVPGGNFSGAWLELFKIIGTSPELNQQFDITRIFMHIAHQLGAKNIEDFKRNVNQIQPEVRPDEEVVRDVERGDLVPAIGE